MYISLDCSILYMKYQVTDFFLAFLNMALELMIEVVTLHTHISWATVAHAVKYLENIVFLVVPQHGFCSANGSYNCTNLLSFTGTNCEVPSNKHFYLLVLNIALAS